MGITEKTVYSCDRCEKESEDKNFTDDTSCGRATVYLSGNNGGKSYDGAWGGSSYDYSVLLCGDCGDQMRKLYEKFIKCR